MKPEGDSAAIAAAAMREKLPDQKPEYLYFRTRTVKSMKKGDLVYVSGPYTKGNVNDNVRAAVQVGERLKEMELLPFIPHLYHLWDLISPHDYQYWMELCVDWVPKCQAVFRIAGSSSGADVETELAEKHHIPVVTNFPDLLQMLED